MIRQSQGWKRPKNRFSALFSEDMNFREKKFKTKYALNTHTQILSALLRILKKNFESDNLAPPPPEYYSY